MKIRWLQSECGRHKGFEEEASGYPQRMLHEWQVKGWIEIVRPKAKPKPEPPLDTTQPLTSHVGKPIRTTYYRRPRTRKDK